MHCGRRVDQHGDLFHPWNGGLENLKVLCNETPQPPGSSVANPVTLPPGCARLLTRPSPIGSATLRKTIGIVGAAVWIAAAESLVEVTITSGPKVISSARSAGICSVRP